MVPLLVLWVLSPAIAHALSAPAARLQRPLSARHRGEAMRLALLHWRYFDRFVTAETQWLAPDNYQEDPAPVVAMRTSPTNLGLQLLAMASARDLGFITTPEMVRRLELAFRSMERMRRYRGHFFNWYDLHDLAVLEPAYVSTVDSGNLAGHLIALRHACLQARDDAAGDPPELAGRLEALAERAYGYVAEMDFGFLFDRERELFSIGYQHGTRSLDPSYYDLLASESRLASFVAIAKNEVPVDHWFRLGRTLTRAAGETALVSWSGSMFEYLMPALVMRSFPFTVLDQTYRGAVRRQIAYGRERGVPWGVSESAYNLRDRHLTYQYRAFGVPDLALKRGLGRDLVIAPYASALAVLVDPARALGNLATLEENGRARALRLPRRPRLHAPRSRPALRGGRELHGAPRRDEPRRAHQRAHRAGVAERASTRTRSSAPRSCCSTSGSRAGSCCRSRRRPGPTRRLPAPEVESPAVREFDRADTPQPHVALLGRAPYTVMVSHCGSGYSRYEDLAVTRWRADGTTDATGQFCYVKDVTRGRGVVRGAPAALRAGRLVPRPAGDRPRDVPPLRRRHRDADRDRGRPRGRGRGPIA